MNQQSRACLIHRFVLHSFVRLFVCSFFRLFVRSLVLPFVGPLFVALVRSLARSVVGGSVNQSVIHSFMFSCTQLTNRPNQYYLQFYFIPSPYFLHCHFAEEDTVTAAKLETTLIWTLVYNVGGIKAVLSKSNYSWASSLSSGKRLITTVCNRS